MTVSQAGYVIDLLTALGSATYMLKPRRCSSAADTFKCLRGLSTDVLSSVNQQIALAGFFGTFIYSPVVDGTFITDRPSVLLKAKKTNSV